MPITPKDWQDFPSTTTPITATALKDLETRGGAYADARAAAAQAASQPVDSDLTAIASLTTTTYGRSLLALANAAAARTSVGLGNVDNTSDAAKPVSSAQQSALDAKAAAAHTHAQADIASLSADLDSIRSRLLALEGAGVTGGPLEATTSLSSTTSLTATGVAA